MLEDHQQQHADDDREHGRGEPLKIDTAGRTSGWGDGAKPGKQLCARHAFYETGSRCVSSANRRRQRYVKVIGVHALPGLRADGERHFGSRRPRSRHTKGFNV